MRGSRVAISICLLLAFVLGLPAVARARTGDQCYASACYTDDLDAPVVVEPPPTDVAPVDRAYDRVDLAATITPLDIAPVEVLTCAPKTSPPVARCNHHPTSLLQRGTHEDRGSSAP